MATFKICVRKDVTNAGIYPVYIRVTQSRKIAYIKTDKMVNRQGLTKELEIKDPYVMQHCMRKIADYMEALNKQDTEHWTVQEVVRFLKNGNADVSFSEYARKHRDRMINRGQERNARNYNWALQHLERFAGTNDVKFSMLTSTFLNAWIKSMEQTKRAKEKYPICMRQVYKEAMKELNDEERGVVRIKFNPWPKVQIPRPDTAEKLAISPEECREFFSAPIPDSKMKFPLTEFGRDVAKMVLCLGGMNTVDIFNLKKSDFHHGIIHYKRAKTKKFRADGAYMEMRVPPIIKPLFEKYGAFSEEGANGYDRESGEEWLFDFHKRHSSSDSFGSNVNRGIQQLCEDMGLPKEKWYCVYTFRHTWGTIAQNDCGASISEVAFGMNHSAGNKVTRGYLKINFAPAWELNEKVIELVFFTPIKGSREVEEQEDVFERFSPKYMMRGEVFFRGKLLGKIEDIGYSNVDEMIAILAEYVPEYVPQRSIVHFKITNLDKGQTAVYERMKGKGI